MSMEMASSQQVISGPSFNDEISFSMLVVVLED
jgi:hypothetical protein